MKIAVLMTCYNRKATTLGCLRRLLPQLDSDDGVFLLDDGSTDGTSDAIRALGDSRIRIIQGDGTFYWAKGMRACWDAAGDGWDAYLWLNDDTELESDALEKMMTAAFMVGARVPRDRSQEQNNPYSVGARVTRDHSQEIQCNEIVVVGDLADRNGAKTYGLTPEGLFSGNVVLVTKGAADKVGKICGDFHHAWADVDYALRCRKAGIQVVSAGVVGHAEGHAMRPTLKGKSLSERWRLLFDPKGWCVHDVWLYRRRNWGFWKALASFAHVVCHVLLGSE